VEWTSEGTDCTGNTTVEIGLGGDGAASGESWCIEIMLCVEDERNIEGFCLEGIDLVCLMV
jgi:hypothetical protein